MSIDMIGGLSLEIRGLADIPSLIGSHGRQTPPQVSLTNSGFQKELKVLVVVVKGCHLQLSPQLAK